MRNEADLNQGGAGEDGREGDRLESCLDSRISRTWWLFDVGLGWDAELSRMSPKCTTLDPDCFGISAVSLTSCGPWASYFTSLCLSLSPENEVTSQSCEDQSELIML